MPVQTRSQKAVKSVKAVKKEAVDRKTRSTDSKKRPKKTFYEWVPVDPNEVEKPFAGKEYDEAAARRDSFKIIKPVYKFASAERLEKLGLTPDSRDPSGKYKLVVSCYKLGIGYYGKKEKWAVAPPGYCWWDCSDSDYYNYDWCELGLIPTQKVEVEV